MDDFMCFEDLLYRKKWHKNEIHNFDSSSEQIQETNENKITFAIYLI